MGRTSMLCHAVIIQYLWLPLWVRRLSLATVLTQWRAASTQNISRGHYRQVQQHTPWLMCHQTPTSRRWRMGHQPQSVFSMSVTNDGNKHMPWHCYQVAGQRAALMATSAMQFLHPCTPTALAPQCKTPPSNQWLESVTIRHACTTQLNSTPQQKLHPRLPQNKYNSAVHRSTQQ